MPLPLVGAHAVLEGMPEFNRNADQVNSKIGGIHEKMSGLGGIASKAGGLVGGAFKAMAIGTVGAVSSVGAVGGAILKLGYDAANLPGIESVFKNMTNAMGVDADALMGKMRDASYGAVKDFDLMKSANKAMVGAGQEFGKEFAENLPALMKVSREAAKAQGLSVEYMYDSIVTGIKRMSPMILDNLGFQISLGEAQEKYAAKVGKTSAELSKEEKQIALLNEVTRLGNQLVEESGGHVDSVQKSVTAWGTALGNVKDRVGIELVPVLQKFMDIIGKPGQGMQDAIVGAAHSFVEWLLPAIDKVAQAISILLNGPFAMLIKGLGSIGLGGIKTLGESLGNMFTGGKINFYDLKQTVSKALEPLLGKDMAQEMGNRAVDLVAGIQKALGPLRDWITANILPAFNSIATTLGTVFDTISIIIDNGFDFRAIAWEDLFPPNIAKTIYDIIGGFEYLGKIVSSGDLGAAMAEFGGPIQFLLQAFNIDLPAGIATFVQSLDTIISVVAAVIQNWGALGDFPWEDILPPELVPIAYSVAKAVEDVGFALGTLINGLVGAVGLALGGDMTSAWEAFGGTLARVFGPDAAQALDNFRVLITDIFGNMSELVSNSQETILAIIQTVWPYIQTIISTVWTAVSAVILTFVTTILPALFAGFNILLEWVNANWPAIQNIILTVLNAIGTVITAVVTTVLPWLVAGFQGIVDWVVVNWPQISATIGAVLTFISDMIQIFLANVSAFWQSYGDNVLAIVSATWDLIKTFIETVITVIGEVIQLAMAVMRGDWAAAWEAFKDIVSTVWEALKRTVSDALTILGNLIVVAWGLLKTNIKIIWDSIWLIISNIWDSIKKTISDALASVRNAMIDEFGKIKQDWENLWNGLAQIVTDVWNNIKQAVADGINGAIDIINHFIGIANSVIKHVPGATLIDELDHIKLAAGGILNRPVFVAGEAGAEVVAPLQDLMSMIQTSMVGAITDMTYAARVPYSGPQPNAVYDYGGDSYSYEYNLTTQSINRPGTLAMEFRAMELAHA